MTTTVGDRAVLQGVQGGALAFEHARGALEDVGFERADFTTEPSGAEGPVQDRDAPAPHSGAETG